MCTALFPDLYESSATTKARYRTPARARKHTIHTLCASLSLCPRPHLFPCSLFLSLLSHTRARKHTHTYTRTVELQPGADSCRAVSPHRCGRHGDNTSVPVTRDRPKGSFPSGTPPRQGVAARVVGKSGFKGAGVKFPPDVLEHLGSVQSIGPHLRIWPPYKNRAQDARPGAQRR